MKLLGVTPYILIIFDNVNRFLQLSSQLAKEITFDSMNATKLPYFRIDL